MAKLTGRYVPLMVAVHEHGDRARDFRPSRVVPSDWRPNISGRATDFDHCLLTEVREQVESRFGVPKKRILFGHSLAGFYALDMLSRQKFSGFWGVYAFSPTFSHDMSLLDRLDEICASDAQLYANIGWESRREHATFDKAAKAFGSRAGCSDKLTLSSHPGVPHQLIMLTGQIENLFSTFAG